MYNNYIVSSYLDLVTNALQHLTTDSRHTRIEQMILQKTNIKYKKYTAIIYIYKIS